MSASSSRRSGELAELHCEHGAAQCVLERLTGAQIGRERQGPTTSAARIARSPDGDRAATVSGISAATSGSYAVCAREDAPWRRTRCTVPACRRHGLRFRMSRGLRPVRRSMRTRRSWARWPSRWRRPSPSSNMPHFASPRVAGRRSRCPRPTGRGRSWWPSTYGFTRRSPSTATGVPNAYRSRRTGRSQRSPSRCWPPCAGSAGWSRSIPRRRRRPGRRRSTRTKRTQRTTPTR